MGTLLDTSILIDIERGRGATPTNRRDFAGIAGLRLARLP